MASRSPEARSTSARKRVLVTGMGGQLGSLVASELEKQLWAGDIVGIDADPPRRRLKRSEFHLVDSLDTHRLEGIVHEFDPHVLVHLAVWEPDARATPTHAEAFTRRYAGAVFSVARLGKSLEHVVLRSGIEVYGRGGQRPQVPDESAPTAPTTQYGRMLVELERLAGDAFSTTNADVTPLRLAPVVGPHVPSPLGRLLRMPMVPFNILRQPSFTVLHELDAAQAFVLAASRTIGTPINIVASGEISGFQAIRRGNHVPFPLVGPEWVIARRIAHLFGAPVPDHVMEVLHHGRRATSSNCASLLDWEPQMSVDEVVNALFEWEGVVHQPSRIHWSEAS